MEEFCITFLAKISEILRSKQKQNATLVAAIFQTIGMIPRRVACRRGHFLRSKAAQLRWKRELFFLLKNVLIICDWKTYWAEGGIVRCSNGGRSRSWLWSCFGFKPFSGNLNLGFWKDLIAGIFSLFEKMRTRPCRSTHGLNDLLYLPSKQASAIRYLLPTILCFSTSYSAFSVRKLAFGCIFVWHRMLSIFQFFSHGSPWWTSPLDGLAPLDCGAGLAVGVV